jgi:hypothetical protein
MGSSLSANATDEPRIYSAGACPVCADSGALILLKASGSGAMLFLCPLCGVAWSEPPLDRQLDEITPLESLAPNGVSLPTASEVLGLGLALTEVSSRDWLPLLQGLLDQSR